MSPLACSVKEAGPELVADLLQALVTEQARQGAQIAAILRLLERGRGARDEADAALLVAVVESVGDRQFTSRQLEAHADADPALREALLAADVTSAQELGCVFRRLEGAAVGGFRLERVAVQRAGIVWAVRVCEA